MIGILGIGRHGRLRTLLSSYIDGEVSAQEARRVDEHLAGCAECRRELQELRATVELLGALPELAVHRSFQLEREPAPVRFLGSYAWATGLATSVATLLLVALVLGDVFSIVVQTGQPDAEPAELAVEMAAAARAAPAPAAPMAAAAIPAPADEPEEAAEMAAAPVAAMAAPAPAPAPAAIPAPGGEPEKAAEIAAAPVAAMAAPALAPAPAPAAAAPVAAMAVPPPAPAEGASEAGAPDIAAAVAEEEAVTLESPAGLSPQPLVAPVAESAPAEIPVSAADAAAGLRLPLRELQIAASILSALLLAATVWLVRRSRRWPL